MQGFLRATLPTKVATVSMYVTLVALSWTIWVAYTVATVGPTNVSGCLGSGGALTGAREGKSLSRQATTALKPGGSATFGRALGTLLMWNLTSPVQLACIPPLFDTGPSFTHSLVARDLYHLSLYCNSSSAW